MKKIAFILSIIMLVGLFASIVLFLSDWLFVTSFIALLFIAINLIWEVLPLDIRRIFKADRKRFVIIVLICLIFFFFGGTAINHYWLPEIFHPLSLLGNVGILLSTIFLGWTLTKLIKKRILFIGIAVSIFFIFLLAIAASKTYRYIGASSNTRLKSLSYLNWVPAENIEKIGVTKNREDLSYKGFNIYSDYSPMAYLIDMSGEIVHTWSDGTSRWQHVEICDNGDLLGIVKDRSLVKLDWNSNIRWVKKMRFHHNVAVAENKDIYALVNKNELVFNSNLLLPILNDYIIVLSPDGKTKKELSLFKILKKKIPLHRFFKLYHWSIIHPRDMLLIIAMKLRGVKTIAYYDIFHTNTIEIIDRDIDGLCDKGNLLICVRNLDLIGILDIEKEKLIWSWGPGNLDRPHHPTLLGNGNILIFDNGWDRSYSRIVELNPFIKNIVWEYTSNPPEQFYTRWAGSNQRLPNGNTLITETDKGHVFEITLNGEVVWEFYNPDIKGMRRRPIYQMTRITDLEKYSLLN